MLDVIKALEEMPVPVEEAELEERFIEGIKLVSFAISQQLSLRHNEIAIHVISTDGDCLRFVHPQELYGSSFAIDNNSVAGTVAQSGEAVIHNSLLGIRRIKIFEKLKTAGRAPEPLHKMATLPIQGDDGVYGVVQVSRRGDDVKQVGKDFNKLDMLYIRPLLKALAEVIVKYRPAHF